MKYAVLIMYELRGVKITIEKLYKYIIDFYDADIFIVCQKQYDDDEERLKLFHRRVKFIKLYDKPKPYEYFDIDSEFIYSNYNNMSKKNNEYKGLWNTPGNLQIYINLNEMANVLKEYINDYDYYIGFRSDIDILFPFPDKELFDEIPNNIYGFYPNYCSSWGGIGEANIIHKTFILDYLTCCYDFIKNYKAYSDIFLKKYNVLYHLKDTYEFINMAEENQPIFYSRINQEYLLQLALQQKNIKIKPILNPNFFYTAETLLDYTTTNEIILNSRTNKLCKYEEQLLESYSNSILWEEKFTWKYKFGKLALTNEMAGNITIDILIPNFNKGKYIGETLNSIFNQQTNYNYQVLINDDCSSDNSIEIINKYIKLYSGKIKLVKNITHLGLFKTIINLYQLTKSDYFTVIDSDDYWCNNYFLEHGLNFLEANKEYTLYANNTIKLKDNLFTEYLYHTNKVCNIDCNNLTYMPHTSATIFRNIIFKEEIPQKLLNMNTIDSDSFRGDSFRILLHLDKGKGFLEFGKISGVYRITTDGIWNSLQEFDKIVFNIKNCLNMNNYFDNNYRKTFLNTRYLYSLINNLLNNRQLNMRNANIIYDILIEYLQSNNHKNIDNESFLFYNIDNYDYDYKYIFIMIINLFAQLNKEIYYIGEKESFNLQCYNENTIFLDQNNIDVPEETIIILPYNYAMLVSTIKNNNIFYIGDFK